MSSFRCEHCGTDCLDSPHGYTTGCEHYPADIPERPQTIDTSKITRFEVIDIDLGRVFVVPAGYASLTLSVQDEGRTLKVFLTRTKKV